MCIISHDNNLYTKFTYVNDYTNNGIVHVRCINIIIILLYLLITFTNTLKRDRVLYYHTIDFED